MDIKAFSSVDLSATKNHAAIINNIAENKPPEPSKVNTAVQKQSGFKTALPYVEGAIILAGLGLYAIKRGQFNTKIAEMTKKYEGCYDNANKLFERSTKLTKALTEASSTITELKTEVLEKAKEIDLLKKEVAQKTAQLAEKTAEEEKALAKNTESAAKKVKKPKKPKITKQDIDAYVAQFNLEDPQIIEKIKMQRQKEAENIERIIEKENFENGHMNFKKLKKVVDDYLDDDAGRGEDRFHQAADILEQALIKENIKFERSCQKAGLDFYLRNSQETDLYKLYAQMPEAEAVVRVKHLQQNDLYADWYTPGPSLEEWFDETIKLIMQKREELAKKAEQAAEQQVAKAAQEVVK